MSLDDWRYTIAISCFILILVGSIPIILKYNPKKIQPFIALGVLGKENKMDKYYPNNDPNIALGDDIHWNLYIYNHIKEAQYVAIKIKLLNSSMPTPNSTLKLPCPTLEIYEIQHVLVFNETVYLPFNWSLLQTKKVNNSTSIDSIMINGEIINVNVQDLHKSFRIIFELWAYNDSKNFDFGWESDDESYAPWNQVWFNLTL